MWSLLSQFVGGAAPPPANAPRMSRNGVDSSSEDEMQDIKSKKKKKKKHKIAERANKKKKKLKHEKHEETKKKLKIKKQKKRQKTTHSFSRREEEANKINTIYESEEEEEEDPRRSRRSTMMDYSTSESDEILNEEEDIVEEDDDDRSCDSSSSYLSFCSESSSMSGSDAEDEGEEEDGTNRRGRKQKAKSRPRKPGNKESRRMISSSSSKSRYSKKPKSGRARSKRDSRASNHPERVRDPTGCQPHSGKSSSIRRHDFKKLSKQDPEGLRHDSHHQHMDRKMKGNCNHRHRSKSSRNKTSRFAMSPQGHCHQDDANGEETDDQDDEESVGSTTASPLPQVKSNRRSHPKQEDDDNDIDKTKTNHSHAPKKKRSYRLQLQLLEREAVSTRTRTKLCTSSSSVTGSPTPRTTMSSNHVAVTPETDQRTPSSLLKPRKPTAAPAKLPAVTSSPYRSSRKRGHVEEEDNTDKSEEEEAEEEEAHEEESSSEEEEEEDDNEEEEEESSEEENLDSKEVRVKQEEEEEEEEQDGEEENEESSLAENPDTNVVAMGSASESSENENSDGESNTMTSSDEDEDVMAYEQKLRHGCPPIREKTNQKSIVKRDHSFFETMGGMRDGSEVVLHRPLNKYSQALGRVYFRSCTVSGKEFTVGSKVMLNEAPLDCVLITSLFQATKSFQGYYASKRNTYSQQGSKSSQGPQRRELQKRGHVYMTVRAIIYKQKGGNGNKRFSLRKTKEADSVDVPVWLNEPGLYMVHMPDTMEVQGLALAEQKDIQQLGVKDPGWPIWANARQVHYISQKNETIRWWPSSKKSRLTSQESKRDSIRYRLTYSSSDDSDGLDSESKHLVKFNEKRRRQHPEMPNESENDDSENDTMRSDVENSDEDSGDQDNPSSKRRNDKSGKPATNDAMECDKLSSDESETTIVDNIVNYRTHRLVLDADWPEESDIALQDESERSRGLIMLEPFKKAFPDLRAEIEKAVFSPQQHVECEYVDSVSSWSTTTVDIQIQTKLNAAKTTLGIAKLHPLQERVCAHIIKNQLEDVVVNAPCGSGKSMCFMVPAVLFGGITLVVEPLRALIDSLFRELRKRNINCEKLLSNEAAGHSQALSAYNRLCTLLDERLDGKPLVILTTPELVCTGGTMEILGNLQEQGKLRRVVVDEFDLCIEPKEKEGTCHRPAFAEIVPHIRRVLTRTPVMFLSATASNSAVKLVSWSPSGQKKPKLFLHSNPLPHNHFYRVESRSMTWTDVAARIAKILSDYAREHPEGPQAKALCFFVGRAIVGTFSDLLNEKKITSLAYVGAETEKQKQRNNTILREFKETDVQVLCANLALGRGVDDLPKNIRFCFHVQMPESLPEYLQQTGRAGRDGGATFCYMFYRSADRSRIENILGGRRKELSHYQRRALDLVREYAINGTMCRKEALAKCAFVGEPTHVRCTHPGKIRCDNCLASDCVFSKPKDTEWLLDVTTSIHSFLLRAKSKFMVKNDLREQDLRKESSAWHCIARNIEELSPDLQDKKFLQSLVSGGLDFSLLHDLVRYMNDVCVRSATNKTRSGLIDHIRSKRSIKRFLFQASLPLESFSQDRVPICVSPIKENREDVLEIVGKRQISILLQYFLQKGIETWNRNTNSTIFDRSLDREYSIGETCEDGNDADANAFKAALHFVSKDPRLKSLDLTKLYDAHKHGCGLYWSASVEKDGSLNICHPEIAWDRRMYRKFGADRFLTVRVNKQVNIQQIKELFDGDGISKGHKALLFGRTYRYLWCKKEKDPQQFVLFAEEGPGLSPTSVSDVLNWAIPHDLNGSLSIAKRLKRMKLWFSTTIPTACLPAGSVRIVPDYNLCDNFSEIDGCGLISQDALHVVWDCYRAKTASEKRSDSCICPHTGFQGRLGGFKGTWVLDRALGTGIVVHCRTSQHKFQVPQSCLQSTSNRADSMEGKVTEDDHSVFEVSSWDKDPTPAKLNVRLIQLLEHYGASWEFFEENCLEPAIKDLEEMMGSGPESKRAWLKHLKERQRSNVLKSWTDSRKCLKLLCANVATSDPELCRFKKKLVSEMFRSLQSKAHYPLSGCVYLRMYGDHTLLLEEGEAFVACNGVRTGLDALSEEILAMRSPSYFGGDMRRLSLVSLDELKKRSRDPEHAKRFPSGLRSELVRSGQEAVEFFACLKNCIVLCNKGKRSEADRMSGGDYDGDLAWVCWNQKLMESLTQTKIAAEDICDIVDNPLELGKRSAWDPDNQVHELDYARKFKMHHVTLGKLSNALDAAIDQFGFGSPQAQTLGRALFLQVDVPDTPLLRQEEEATLLESIKTPHWALKDRFSSHRSYKSNKMLGTLFDALKNRMELAMSGSESVDGEMKLDPLISKLVDPYRGNQEWRQLEMRMRTAVELYITEKAKYWENRSVGSHDRIVADASFGNNKNDQEKEQAAEEGRRHYETWKLEYFTRARTELGRGEESRNQTQLWEVKPQVWGATLYMVGWECHQEWTHKRQETSHGVQHKHAGGPMEFVWGVAEGELLKDVFYTKSLIVAEEVEALVLGI